MNILFSIFMFVAGFVCGALVIYGVEKRAFKLIQEQYEELAEEKRRLRDEREEYTSTRSMFDIIDDLPDYLRDKYTVPTNTNFTYNDEDITEIYV